MDPRKESKAMKAMPICLVVKDKCQIILNGIADLFRQEDDFKLAACCINGRQTMEAVRKHKPDVVILGDHMPGKDGLGIVYEIQAEKLPARVVLFTEKLTEDQMVEALRAGVQGIVLKEMAPQLLVQCVRKVHAGDQWLERRAVTGALEKLMKRESEARELTSLLTAREINVARMTAQGLRNKEIATKLFISEGTVKAHLHNIYEKLSLDGRFALLRYAQERGLL